MPGLGRRLQVHRRGRAVAGERRWGRAVDRVWGARTGPAQRAVNVVLLDELGKRDVVHERTLHQSHTLLLKPELRSRSTVQPRRWGHEWAALASRLHVCGQNGPSAVTQHSCRGDIMQPQLASYANEGVGCTCEEMILAFTCSRSLSRSLAMCLSASRN